MTNKKLVLAPAVLLSSALLLTACSFGNPATNTKINSSAAASPSSSATFPANGNLFPPSLDSEAADNAVDKTGDITQEQYKSFYYSPPTLTDRGWMFYKPTGATTYKEDPAARSITATQWNAAKVGASKDSTGSMAFGKIIGEMNSDLDQSALNISGFLAKNPSANLESIKADKSLIINRYPNVGKTDVHQESATGFYFVVFKPNEHNIGIHGIIVPQDNKTPKFDSQTPAGP